MPEEDPLHSIQDQRPALDEERSDNSGSVDGELVLGDPDLAAWPGAREDPLGRSGVMLSAVDAGAGAACQVQGQGHHGLGSRQRYGGPLGSPALSRSYWTIRAEAVIERRSMVT